MRKIWIGDGSPPTTYRPWPEKRRAAARARIAEARTRLGWSDSEIARRSSVSPGTIRRIAGRESSQPLRNVVSAICAAVETGLNEKLAAFARQLEAASVPLLPAPREPAADGWHDASTVPIGIWVCARSYGSALIKRVCYEPSENEWYPWIESGKNYRYRWDRFDKWRSEPAARL